MELRARFGHTECTMGLGIPSKVVKVANSYQMVDQVSHNLKLELQKTGRN